MKNSQKKVNAVNVRKSETRFFFPSAVEQETGLKTITTLPVISGVLPD